MIVFAGPSVPLIARHRYPDVDWHPPAIAGDLLALVDSNVERVLLIDGLFDERASIKHKEAMALMASGTQLFGATSMGALRGAELRAFGMIPLGRIANAYCAGLLVGDDEVALVHGNERIGWKAVSVPMVDVRATLCHAVYKRLITVDEARQLRACWHDIHYADRDWPAMIAAQQVVPDACANAIAASAIEFKCLDAADAIERAITFPTKVSRPHVAQTLFLDRLTAGA